MTQSIVERLTLKTRIGYGIGDIAICLYWSGVGLYLLYFYTDVVGISGSLAGLIYFIALEINHVIFLPNLLEMIHQIGILKKATMPLVNKIIPWCSCRSKAYFV